GSGLKARRVAVVGLGLMGGSLALALRQAAPGVRLVGVDRDPRTLEKARQSGVVDEAAAGLDVVEGADLVVLAVPIDALRQILAAGSGHFGEAVVTDLASTKAQVLSWAAEAGVDLVGGHPLCGRERSGLEAADAGLFRGAAWVLTRPEPAVVEVVEAVGARVVVLDPDTHDRLLAGVSHAAFLLSTAYVLALAGSPDWPQMSALAASGFRDLSRLAEGDSEMYAAIVRTNREHVAAHLDAVLGSLQRVRRHLAADDVRLVELFEEAKAVRERWRKEADAGPG
ncbi:MAG TPA: prephenate dehydrogenase/arogenate dehydrogenase family protein, partial [Candidatus Acidoferrales bacterium]|nr:prephenate dehydrogenase/arogenate dehydrogenase family protein [Candidatus Acidoferrales bacterium]